MEFLASDALRGRGSGTADELVAATYVAAQLRAYGIAPAGTTAATFSGRPCSNRNSPRRRNSLSLNPEPGEKIAWTYGKEFVACLSHSLASPGPLHVFNADEDDPNVAGAIVLISGMTANGSGPGLVAGGKRSSGGNRRCHCGTRRSLRGARQASPSPAGRNRRRRRFRSGKRLEPAGGHSRSCGDPQSASGEYYSEPSMAPSTSDQSYTWNAVGILRGSDPVLQQTAVLLSAHLDHLGIGPPVNGDTIYNGADDDASGTTAVLELARVLGSGPKPRRTVIFALFGSEETGGQGSTYFLQHPPVPLQHIAVNLEFEMLGRADPAVSVDTVWLTGWERSNLGPMLAAHGAKLVGDPHPEQNFFARSDNYVLAKKGVVAQTVSSYGLHSDYHQPSDDIAHIDFEHMDAAIGSLLRPVRWLVNSSFTPQWNEGGNLRAVVGRQSSVVSK